MQEHKLASALRRDPTKECEHIDARRYGRVSPLNKQRSKVPIRIKKGGFIQSPDATRRLDPLYFE